MILKEIIDSFIAALLVYQDKKGTHIKRKNEIARKLLLAAAQTNQDIQTSTSQIIQEGVALYLYRMLIFSQDALTKLKSNKEGELDSLVKIYIEKWRNATQIMMSIYP